MKQILTLLLPLLLLTFSKADAQKFVRIYKSEYKVLNEAKEEWIIKKTEYPQQLVAEFAINMITVRTKTPLILYTEEKRERVDLPGIISYKWKAVDNKKVPCTVSITYYPEYKTKMLTVYYMRATPKTSLNFFITDL
jgi:hypothetical protein